MLSIREISRIEKEVKSSGIKFSHLPDDLIDHICCDVEEQMEEGSSFDQAFKNVKGKIGMEGLKKIEVQTLLFINQNYIIMKKSMKILSILSFSLVVVSGILKILHLPGANILLSLGFLSLLFGFIPLLFLTRNKEDTERKQVAVNLSAFLASIFFLTSIWFALMHWPGKNYLVVVSWVLILFFFLPSYLITVIKNNPKDKRATHIGVILLIAVLMVMEIVLVLNRSRADYMQYEFVVNNNEELNNFFLEENKVLLHELQIDTSLNSALTGKLENVLSEGRELREKIVSLADNIDKINDFSRIRFRDNIPDDMESRANEIRDLITDLQSSILSIEGLSPALRTVVEETLETSKIGETSVYNIYFVRPPVMIRNNLLRISKDILFIENEILKAKLE